MCGVLCILLLDLALSCCMAAVGGGTQVVLHHSESSEQSRNFTAIQKMCGGVLTCDLDARCLLVEGFVKKTLWLGVSLMAPALHPVKISSMGIVPEAAQTWNNQATSTAGFPHLLGHECFQKEDLAPQRYDGKDNLVLQNTHASCGQ